MESKRNVRSVGARHDDEAQESGEGMALQRAPDRGYGSGIGALDESRIRPLEETHAYLRLAHQVA